jgi:hypothetical protein
MGARPEGFLMPRKGGNTVHSEVSFAAAENRLENRFEEIPEKTFSRERRRAHLVINGGESLLLGEHVFEVF